MCLLWSMPNRRLLEGACLARHCCAVRPLMHLAMADHWLPWRLYSVVSATSSLRAHSKCFHLFLALPEH